MKHLLIIFTLLLTSVSWSKDVDYTDLVKRDGLWYEKFTDKPFTGKVTGAKIEFDGTYRHFPIQGKIKKGKKEGEWLSYYENGQLKEKRNFKDGKLNSERLVYYENGQLSYKSNYKDGKQHGEEISYMPNNPLLFIRNYEDGKEDGEWLQYDKYNGQLLDKNNYKDGKIEGKQFTYYENGQIEYMINYKDGKRNGEALSYHENGKVYKTEIWKDDELIKTIKH